MATTDDPTIAAMLRERDAYLRVGKSDRAAMVTAELARRGYAEDDPHKTPPQGRQVRPQQTAEQGIVALREQAEALGIKPDGRWSAQRLEQEIAKAQAQ